jgi:hypothetical protein
VQGLIIVDAAISLGVSIPKSVMALAYGRSVNQYDSAFLGFAFAWNNSFKDQRYFPFFYYFDGFGLFYFYFKPAVVLSLLNSS